MRTLDVPLRGQVESVWCWASAAQMIIGAHGIVIDQCSRATARANRNLSRDEGREPDLEPAYCCDPTFLRAERDKPPAERRCVLGGWPKRTFSEMGFTYEHTRDDCEPADHCALSWEQLTGEIDAGRPVAFSWRFNENGEGHMMVAAGYVFAPPDGRWVLVHDPWPPLSGDRMLISYDYYVSGPNGLHWRDFWKIQPISDQDPSGQ